MSDTSKSSHGLSADSIPLLETLGSTYDVLGGKYADPESAQHQVIDWSKSENRTLTFIDKQYSVPSAINFNSDIKSDYYSASGKSTVDYSKELNVKAGLEAGYSAFSASASADYSKTQKENLANTFTRVTYSVPFYILSLPTTDEIRGLLKEHFVHDLESMDPAELYKQYGTHLLRSMTVGGRATFLSSTDSRKYSSEISIEAAAAINAKFGVTAGKAEMSVKDKEAKDSFNEHSEVRVVTEGGNPKYGNENYLNNTEAWADSIPTWLRFVDFGSRPGLIELWELASTPERRVTLKTAYLLLASGNGSKLSFPGPYIRVSPAALIEEGAVPLPPLGNTSLCYPAVTEPWHPIGFGPITVSEIVPGALSTVKWEVAFIVDWTWRDMAQLKIKFWRAIPPLGYAALGFVGVLAANDEEELPEIAKQVRAVHTSALTRAKDLSVFCDLGDAKHINVIDKIFLHAGRGLHVEDFYAFNEAEVKLVM